MEVRALIALVVAACLLAPGWSGAPARVSKNVSFAILEDYDKGDDLADIAHDFALFNELEITTWRGSFGWDDYEPERDAFDFGWLQRFVELAYSHGIKLRPYLAYTPEWAARAGGKDAEVWNNPPRDADRFARFAAEAARELRRYPNVLSYEIYNEENVAQWWDGDASTYARVLEESSRAIKRVDRDAQIVFGGLVFPDADWIESVCGRRSVRGSFDVLPFHAYPETWTPPDVTVENYLGGLDGFITVADEACGKLPIWINETGFATVAGKTEREQAAWWVRAVATFLAHPRVEHIGIYEIKDLAPDKPAIGDQPNYHLGLTRFNRSKKLAFQTVDVLTDLLDTGTLHIVLDGAEIIEESGGGRVFSHMFERPDGDRIFVVWSRGGDTRIAIRLREHASRATELALDGTSSPAPPFDTHIAVTVTLAETPRIFRLAR